MELNVEDVIIYINEKRYEIKNKVDFNTKDALSESDCKKRLECIQGKVEEVLKLDEQNWKLFVDGVKKYYNKIYDVRSGNGKLPKYEEKSVIKEVIQNIVDCEYLDKIDVKIECEDEEKKICFRYNEKGFRIEDIIAFFNRGNSVKESNEMLAGEFGIGIKSALLWTERAQLHSVHKQENVETNISICSQKESLSIEKMEWIRICPEEKLDEGTQFTLYLKDSMYEKLKADLKKLINGEKGNYINPIELCFAFLKKKEINKELNLEVKFNGEESTPICISEMLGKIRYQWGLKKEFQFSVYEGKQSGFRYLIPISRNEKFPDFVDRAGYNYFATYELTGITEGKNLPKHLYVDIPTMVDGEWYITTDRTDISPTKREKVKEYILKDLEQFIKVESEKKDENRLGIVIDNNGSLEGDLLLEYLYEYINFHIDNEDEKWREKWKELKKLLLSGLVIQESGKRIPLKDIIVIQLKKNEENDDKGKYENLYKSLVQKASKMQDKVFLIRMNWFVSKYLDTFYDWIVEATWVNGKSSKKFKIYKELGRSENKENRTPKPHLYKEVNWDKENRVQSKCNNEYIISNFAHRILFDIPADREEVLYFCHLRNGIMDEEMLKSLLSAFQNKHIAPATCIYDANGMELSWLGGSADVRNLVVNDPKTWANLMSYAKDFRRGGTSFGELVKEHLLIAIMGTSAWRGMSVENQIQKIWYRGKSQFIEEGENTFFVVCVEKDEKNIYELWRVNCEDIPNAYETMGKIVSTYNVKLLKGQKFDDYFCKENMITEVFPYNIAQIALFLTEKEEKAARWLLECLTLCRPREKVYIEDCFIMVDNNGYMKQVYKIPDIEAGRVEILNESSEYTYVFYKRELNKIADMNKYMDKLLGLKKKFTKIYKPQRTANVKLLAQYPFALKTLQSVTTADIKVLKSKIEYNKYNKNSESNIKKYMAYDLTSKYVGYGCFCTVCGYDKTDILDLYQKADLKLEKDYSDEFWQLPIYCCANCSYEANGWEIDKVNFRDENGEWTVDLQRWMKEVKDVEEGRIPSLERRYMQCKLEVMQRTAYNLFQIEGDAGAQDVQKKTIEFCLTPFMVALWYVKNSINKC